MAFTGDLKYQSVFYNYFKKKVDVQIYKRGYSGAVAQVRTSEVSIEPNFQDENTAVIGTGARVVIIADTAQMTQYEDLLVSLEKEFLCIIQYNNAVVFSGYSICDLNERQFLPFAAITLQFTDYLRRLESYFLPCLSNAGGMSKIMEIVSEALTEVDNDTTLYVNSSLFEEGMSNGSTDEFLSQTYLDNYMFHSDPTTFDNGYEALNKALLSFGAYLYSFKGMLAVERQEDVLRTYAWVRFMDVLMSLPSADTYASQKQALNRQTGDFNYVDMSQVVAYESGLKTLILKLQDKQLDSFVFNDYDKSMASISDETPEAGTLDLRTWYKHDDVSISAVSYEFRGMSSYIKWTYAPSVALADVRYRGLYYDFQVQFDINPEETTTMTVNFSMTSDMIVVEGADPSYRYTKFAIRVDGGPLSGYYLAEIPSPGGVAPFMGFSASFFAFEDRFEVRNPKDRLWSVSRTWDMSNPVWFDQPGGLPPASLPSLWEQLGSPASQKFMIYFYPVAIFEAVGIYERIIYLGDIQVSLSQQKILNKLTYYINANFEKTEEIDINFFDLNNVNFVNGPMMLDEGNIINKTNLWISTLNTTPVPLMDVFAKNRFQNYARTIHRLKGTILYDGYIKPFAVITDDNLVISDPAAGDYGETVKFIVQSYTWNLNLGTYDINAQEYTDEDLGFDITQDPGGGSVVLTAPTNADGTQAMAGDGFDLTWDSVTGATGYIIQRMPYWDGSLWIMSWRTIYEGLNTFTYDDLEMITMGATPTHGQSFFYRVAAKTNTQYGPYSSQLHLFYQA